jgi:hypothetical protein
VRADRRALVEALLDGDPALAHRYRHHPEFRQGIDAALSLLEHTVAGLALASDAAINTRRAALRAEGLSSSWVDRHLGLDREDAPDGPR